MEKIYCFIKNMQFWLKKNTLDIIIACKVLIKCIKKRAVESIISFLIILSLAFGCRAYSFSGTKLKKDIKTFSIENCDSRVAMGPADLGDLFSQTIVKCMTQRTQLNQKASEGDLQFSFKIVSFKFSPIATQANTEDNIGSLQRLTIELEVDYKNTHDDGEDKSSFKDKKFSQFADASGDADLDSEEPRLIEEVFEKLADDIINASVANW